MGVPAQSSGRLLERYSDVTPRGMIVQRQNPAYRSTHQILSGRQIRLPFFFNIAQNRKILCAASQNQTLVFAS